MGGGVYVRPDMVSGAHRLRLCRACRKSSAREGSFFCGVVIRPVSQFIIYFFWQFFVFCVVMSLSYYAGRGRQRCAGVGFAITGLSLAFVAYFRSDTTAAALSAGAVAAAVDLLASFATSGARSNSFAVQRFSGKGCSIFTSMLCTIGSSGCSCRERPGLYTTSQRTERRLPFQI